MFSNTHYFLAHKDRHNKVFIVFKMFKMFKVMVIIMLVIMNMILIRNNHKKDNDGVEDEINSVIRGRNNK